MTYGCTLDILKPALMKHYKVTATNLDKGRGIPENIYCIKPYFRFKGEWLPQDHMKIGKSVSLYNRHRTYAQQGSRPRVCWSIDTVDPDCLEKEVHRYFADYHDKEAVRTELFLLDCVTAYAMLDKMIKDLDLDKRKDIVAINRFSPNGLNSTPSSAMKSKDPFDAFFDIE